MRVINILHFTKKLNLFKTFFFNLHYFPFLTAIHLPFLIYKRTEIRKMCGKIIIEGPVRTGMVKIGFHRLGTQDLLYSRTIWDVSGTFVVKGNACIGRGSKISIGRDGILTLGENFTITGNTEIISQKSISFGNNVLLSWDILLMDTDFHHILNDENKIINPPQPITIGNHVWIGCRNTILKGVTIADDNIISANSIITKKITETNCIIGGHGKNVDIIKRNVSWQI
mgnify:CR=1 FL=1